MQNQRRSKKRQDENPLRLHLNFSCLAIFNYIYIATNLYRNSCQTGSKERRKGVRDVTDQLWRRDKKLEKRREPQDEYAVTSARNMKSYNVAADRSHV